MNVLLLTSHSIAEHDDLAMLSSIPGVDVFSIGAYTDPANPSDDARPALDVKAYPHLAWLCEQQRQKHAGEDASWVIDWAKGDLHPELIEWADTIIVHHFPIPWVVAQWSKFTGKRVIWRTCGQSDPQLERIMAGLRPKGLEIVRYSPKEHTAFERFGSFAGEDALIRFGKDPDEWYGWTGEDAVVGNITQNMVERGDACGLRFWMDATQGLPTKPAGPGSQRLSNGLGRLGYDAMREYLRSIRVYLYTGTRPASYTLGLIEAMMTGTPVVSIGPRAFGIPELFEGHEIAINWSDRPDEARAVIREYIADADATGNLGALNRKRAIELFSIEAVTQQWASYLGVRVEVAA